MLLVVLICTLSDAVLIFAGIAGLGAVIDSVPWLLAVFRWGGALYLAWYGIRTLLSALKPSHLDAGTAESSTRRKVVVTVLTLTFLNPHVYLDTVILLGSVAGQFGADRWLFGAGAMLGSAIWFFSIGYGAKAAARFMAKPIFWRVLDFIIAAVMLTLSLSLAFGAP